MTFIQQRASGCLFGLAFGDALGADVEFMSVEAILRSYPPDGPQDLYGYPVRVTDDTQMTLAVGKALLATSRPYTPARLEKTLRKAFIEWNESPENDRAPGITCMRACKALADGLPWYEATITSSKGCGANMRVAPVGLLGGIDNNTRAAIAQFQTALTHGHPTGLAAADLTATAIAEIIAGTSPNDLLQRLQAYAWSQRTIYHEEWLGSLWQRMDPLSISSPEAYISQGWDECLQVLARLETAVRIGDRESDPCEATGDGWIAEEAFATAMLCFLLFPDDPVAAIKRATVTRGDSDSIACLTGAFAGAYHGMGKWPESWIERIEYQEKLAELGETWDR